MEITNNKMVQVTPEGAVKDSRLTFIFNDGPMWNIDLATGGLPLEIFANSIIEGFKDSATIQVDVDDDDNTVITKSIRELKSIMIVRGDEIYDHDFIDDSEPAVIVEGGEV